MDTSTPQSAGLAKAPGQAFNQSKQLTIVRVENGYTITPPYYGGETKVAILLNDMLDIVKGYFEEKDAD